MHIARSTCVSSLPPLYRSRPAFVGDRRFNTQKKGREQGRKRSSPTALLLLVPPRSPETPVCFCIKAYTDTGLNSRPAHSFRNNESGGKQAVGCESREGGGGGRCAEACASSERRRAWLIIRLHRQETHYSDRGEPGTDAFRISTAAPWFTGTFCALFHHPVESRAWASLGAKQTQGAHLSLSPHTRWKKNIPVCT